MPQKSSGTSCMPQSLLSEREGLPGEELVLGPRCSRTSWLLCPLKSHQKPMALAPKKAQVGGTDHPQVPEKRLPGASSKRFSLSPPLPSGSFPNPLDPLGNSWWAIGRAIGYCSSPKGSLAIPSPPVPGYSQTKASSSGPSPSK